MDKRGFSKLVAQAVIEATRMHGLEFFGCLPYRMRAAFKSPSAA
jgi:hypothetical protein